MDHVLEPAWKAEHESGDGFDDVATVENVLLDVKHVDAAARIEQLELAVLVRRRVGFATIDVVNARPHAVRMIVYAVVAAVAQDIGPGGAAELERPGLPCRGRDQAGQLDGPRFDALFHHAGAAGVPVEGNPSVGPAPDVALHLPGGLRFGFVRPLPEL